MPVFQHQGFDTYYEECGSGAPLVLICGISSDLTIWGPLLPELSRTCRVIVYDNRGAGRSSAPDEPYQIGQMAEDLRALLDHLKVDSCALLGWSMGGLIARAFARAHPERVKHLLLLGSMLKADGMLRNFILNWKNVRLSNMPPEQVARFVMRFIFSRELADNAPMYDWIAAAMASSPYRQSVQGFVRQADALLSAASEAPLGALPPMPVTVMVGEQDLVTPPARAQELADALCNGRMRVLPAGHAGFIEQPKAYAAAILDALSGGA